MKTLLARALALVLLATPAALDAQVPQLVNYQGRVAVGSPAVNFNGSGTFKFALVNMNGSTTYWSNDGTSTAGSQPTSAISLTVTNGLYSVLLGDTTITNMTAIPGSVWSNADVRLRVWFNDGTHNFQLLMPDQRLAPTGYLPDGAVSSNAIATNAVTSTKIAAGSVGTTQLAAGTVGAPVVVSGTSQTAAPNTSYVATNAAQTTFTLPATANVGDTIEISGAGAGGWSMSNAWTQQTSGLPGSAIWSSVASSSDGSHLVAVATYTSPASPGGLYTSANSGATWTQQTSGLPTNTFWSSVASSSDGSHLVAVVSTGGIYTSANSGASWTPQTSGLPVSASWTSVASSSDGSHLVAVASGGGIYTSANSGASWALQTSGLPTNPNPGWISVASSSDGSHLAAVVNGGGIYTSVNSGASWTQQTSGLPASAFWYSAASSSDGSHLAAVVYPGGLYTSANSGASWTQQTAGLPTNPYWISVASSSDGSHLAAVVSGGGLYTSSNFGASWTQQTSGLPANPYWQSVASSSDGSHLAGVVNGGGIYTNISGAQGTVATLQYLGNGQWTDVAQTQIAAGTVGNAQLILGAVHAGNIASGAVGSGQLAANAVQNTNIASGAVGSAQIAAGAVGNSQLAANAVQNANIVAGAVGSAQLAPGATAAPLSVAGTTQSAVANTDYVASNAAQTNFTLPTAANVGDVVEISGAGTGGWSVVGVWTQQTNGLPANPYWQSVATSSDGSHLVAVVNGGGIYTSTNFGATWTQQTSGLPASAIWSSVASSSDGSHLVAVATYTSPASPGGLYTSANSGATWTQQTSGLPTNTFWSSVASSSDGSHLVAVVSTGGIYTSANSGASWTPQTSGLPVSASWTSVASSSDGSHLVAVASGGGIYTSANSGASWALQTSGLPTNPNPGWISVASSSDGSHLAAVVNGGGIYTSVNSGASWTQQTSGLPASAFWYSAASSSDGSHLAAVVYPGGLYTSANSGASWSQQTSGLPTNPYWISVASSSDGSHLAAVVSGGGLYTNLSGVQGTTATLQYLGNGQWVALGHTQIAAGAVGSAQIGANAVQGSNIATGAVGSSQLAANAVQSTNIATGAVGATQLAANAVTSASIAPGTINAADINTTSIGLWSVNGTAIYRSSGNVGIGATPAATLDVTGSDATADGKNAGLKITNTSAGGADWYLRSGATGNNTGAGNLSIGDDNAYKFVISGSDSNVGIGTTANILARLTINSTATDGNGTIENGIAFTDNSIGGTPWTQAGIWAVGSTGFNGSLVFGTDGDGVNNNGVTERMRIDQSGDVGIGTATPTQAKLVVSGSVGNTLSSGYYFNQSDSSLVAITSSNFNASIYGSNGIWAGGAVIASSDARIKDIQGVSDRAADLQTLSKIEITDYCFKDVIGKGNGPQKKVIAQQVEKVFPQAVSQHTDVVPDIYRQATVKDGWVQLATNLQVGERVKLIGEKEEGIYEVIAVRVGAFRTAFRPATEKVFVYGREVQDFRTVDYDAIAMLNVSATQELARQLSHAETENAALKQCLAELEARDKDREAREKECEERVARLESLLPATAAPVALKTAINGN